MNNHDEYRLYRLFILSPDEKHITVRQFDDEDTAYRCGSKLMNVKKAKAVLGMSREASDQPWAHNPTISWTGWLVNYAIDKKIAPIRIYQSEETV